jgi:beta-lactamase regulating signal transducer with metallopeptidase domain
MSAWERIETIEAFDAALSAILFFTVVVLAMLACRQPARRILIARVALLASLATIPLSSLTTLPRLDLVNVLLSSDLLPGSHISSFSDQAPHSPTGRVSHIPGREPRFPDLLLHPSAWTWRWFAHVLVLLVLGGMGAGFAWLLLGFGGVQWLIRRSHPPSTATRDLYQQLVTNGSRVAKRSVLRVSTHVHRPVVVGLFRPTILIPESLDLPTGHPEFLQLSLLHELAHVDRYDHWFNTVANLAQTVWFFLPHTWWLRSQLMIDQEFVADQSAARKYGTTSDYASSLLSMAAHSSLRDSGEFGSLATSEPSRKRIGVPSALFQRMLMLLHCPFPIETRAPRLWSWISRIAVVGVLVGAGCLVIRWPRVESATSRSKTPPPPTVRTFRVEYFVAEPLAGPPNGRSIAYVMPLPLPPLFDLDVEVLSRPSELAQIRIAGHPLKTVGPPQMGPYSTAESGSSDAKAWRHVHFHRDHQNVIVKIDGQPLSDESLPEATSESLTIEPGPSAAEFRDLIVTW